MKNLKIYILMLTAILVNMSCESDKEIETVDFGTGDLKWVQFEQESYSILESADGSLEVTVLLAADSNPDGVTINLDYSSSAPSTGYDISPADGVVEIPAGEFSASFSLTPVDNFEEEADKVINVTVSSSPFPVGLGGDSLFSSAQLTIIDDDCPLENGATFLGDYNLVVNTTGILGAPTVADEIVTLTQGATVFERNVILTPYPTLGSFAPFEFSFSLICGNVLVNPVDNIGVGCGGGNAVGPSSTIPSNFDLGDDTSFTINYVDDVRGQCDGVSYEVSFTLTRI